MTVLCPKLSRHTCLLVLSCPPCTLPGPHLPCRPLPVYSHSHHHQCNPCTQSFLALATSIGRHGCCSAWHHPQCTSRLAWLPILHRWAYASPLQGLHHRTSSHTYRKSPVSPLQRCREADCPYQE